MSEAESKRVETMSTQSANPDVEARSVPTGLTVLGLAGFLFLNFIILAYAIYKATPHEPAHAEAAGSGAPAVAAVEPAPAPAPAPVEAAAAPAAAAAPLAKQEAGGGTSVATPIVLPDEAVVKGAYLQHCAACHGLTGRGDGPAASQLYPPPRDFVQSPFRFASQVGGREALIRGLERTIRDGVPRSPMPGFGGVLSDQMIAGLARYVLNLRSAGGPSMVPPPVDLGERPPFTPGLIARGRELYVKVGCATCHGESGHGDGEQADKLVDMQGRPVRPADLTSGLFKSGSQPEDQARVILHGVPGTPMIPYESVLVKKAPDGSRDLTDVWALVAYIRSLQPRHEPPAEHSGAVITAIRAPDAAMVEDPAHPAWVGVRPVSLELKPLWLRQQMITHLDVRAVRTHDAITLCLQWPDGSFDAIRDHGRFPDAVAVMFGMGDAVPTLPMGVRLEVPGEPTPVNIWHWQADRQVRAEAYALAQSVQGLLENITSWHVFAVHDKAKVIPGSGSGVLPNFLTARDAGNVHESPKLLVRSVLEANAAGFGTLTLQKPEQQNVQAAALWANGVWRVVMTRPLEAQDADDVRLTGRMRIPITFAVWDGSKQDRDGTKLITSWHWLTLESMSEAASAAGVSQ